VKIRDGYLLKEVAGSHIVVPVGDLNFEGLINLNETGALIWGKLENGCSRDELVSTLISEYGIDQETASKDVDAFIEVLRKENLIDE
jgi:hypothetical protein